MADAAERGTSAELATGLALAAESKLASDVVVLDMRDLVSYTDYLVICSARNERQAAAIVEEVYRSMKRDHELLPVNPAREPETDWTVLDYLDAVLHVFTGDARRTYDLEDLWYEAPRIEFESDLAGGSGDGETVTG
ncbi:MAG: ribosome silencing factor [Solirubrobacterales bacterium]